jgi:hypothetical protein
VAAADHEPRRQAVAGGHVAADIDQVQPAAGAKDPEHLACRGRFRVVVQVVQHHRRQHAVKFAVGVG